MIGLEFQYTLEDYREAVGAHYARSLAGKANRRRSRRTLFAVTLGLGALALTLPAIVSGASWRDRIIYSIFSLFPWLPMIALIVMSFGMQMVATRGVRAVRLFLLLVAAGTTLLAGGILLLPEPRNINQITSLSAGLYVTWVIFIAFWLRIFVTYLGDRPYVRMWNAQPNLHAPRTLVIDDDGLVFRDALTLNSYRWPAFLKSIETPTLFMLYIGDHMFQMVPKRAFSSAHTMDEFRLLIEHHILRRTRAFPVISLQPSGRAPTVAEASTTTAAPNPPAQVG